MTASAEDVAKLRLQLVDTGWNPIPVYPSTKKPAIEGWSTIEANEFHIENWARSRPAALARDYAAIRITSQSISIFYPITIWPDR